MTGLHRKKNNDSSTLQKTNASFWRTFLHKSALVLNIFMLLPFLAGMLGQYVEPTVWWVLPVCSLFNPWWMIIPVTWAVLWAWFSLKWTVVNTLLVLVNYQQLTHTFQFHGNLKFMPEKDITVVSFNVDAFNYKFEKVKQITNYLTTLKPQIVCFQEFRNELEKGNKAIEHIKKELGLKYHAFEEVLPNSAFGLAIFSAFPIHDHGLVTDTHSTSKNGISYADLHMFGRTVRIYNMHLQSYNLNAAQRELLRDKSPAPNGRKRLTPEPILSAESGWTTVKVLLEAWSKQTLQLRQLNIHRGERQNDVFLIGDLNNPPNTYQYKQAVGNLKDGFVYRGQGFGKTYGSGLKGLRIDYIFGGQNYEFVQFITLPTQHLSDHSALLSKVRLID